MNTRLLIEKAYTTFNERDIDGALALMTEDVDWPKASEGGRVIGKQAVREYWTRQWSLFDAHVDVIGMVTRESGRTEVKVHQLIKSLDGQVLSDTQVVHIYSISNNLIARVDLGDDLAVAAAAFVKP